MANDMFVVPGQAKICPSIRRSDVAMQMFDDFCHAPASVFFGIDCTIYFVKQAFRWFVDVFTVKIL